MSTTTTRRRSDILAIVPLLLFCATVAVAQEGAVEQGSAGKPAPRVVYDDSKVVVRRPSESVLRDLRDDGDFRYDRRPSEEQVTLWDALGRWLDDLFSKALGHPVMGPFWTVFPYVVFAAALIFVIWKMLGAQRRGGFYREGQAVSNPEEIDENIHEMNFEALIATAIRERKYRRAVRLHYLHTLKRLTDRELIAWRADKTNHDYLRELGGSDLLVPFERATILFEYIWYGDFPVDEPVFDYVKETFAAVDNQLSPDQVKKYRLYIALLTITFLLVILFEVFKPIPLDWTPSFAKDKKIPYGGYLLYELLPEIFPSAEIETALMPVYNIAIDSAKAPANYIIVCLAFEPTGLDVEKLLGFVERGNDVFVAAGNYSGPLTDSFDLETDFEYKLGGAKEPPLTMNFVSPALRAPKPYIFTRPGNDGWFTSFDTARAVVLATDSANRPTYLKIAIGAGALYLSSTPRVFSNYHIVDERAGEYVFKALSYLPDRRTIWDEYYKVDGAAERAGQLRYVLSTEALRWAFWILLAGIGIFMIFESKRRQRIIPIVAPPRNDTLDFVTTVGRLYYQHGDHRNIAEKKIQYLLEQMRTRYRVRTMMLDDELADLVAQRSGVEPEQVRRLIRTVRTISTSRAIDEEQLATLNRQIEEFYTNAVR